MIIDLVPPKNTVYAIDYPEYFKRNSEIKLPEVCGCAWNFVSWILHNDVLDPILCELGRVAPPPEADLWRRKHIFNLREDFKLNIKPCSYDDEDNEDDFIIEISLKKPLLVRKEITNILPEVKILGEPYQPERIVITGHEDTYPVKEGVVFCTIGLSARRYVE